jgi:hypothetical protein
LPKTRWRADPGLIAFAIMLIRGTAALVTVIGEIRTIRRRLYYIIAATLTAWCCP